MMVATMMTTVMTPAMAMMVANDKGAGDRTNFSN